MTESTKIDMRTSKAFKRNVQLFIAELYAAGIRDSTAMSDYIKEAVIEKRERDREKLETVTNK